MIASERRLGEHDTTHPDGAALTVADEATARTDPNAVTARAPVVTLAEEAQQDHPAGD